MHNLIAQVTSLLVRRTAPGAEAPGAAVALPWGVFRRSLISAFYETPLEWIVCARGLGLDRQSVMALGDLTAEQRALIEPHLPIAAGWAHPQPAETLQRGDVAVPDRQPLA